MNRLASVTEASVTEGGWSRSYGYDPYGNRWVSGTVGHTLPLSTPTAQGDFSSSTNRVLKNSAAFDNAGNLLSESLLGSMTYDADNHQISYTAGGATTTYDYDGGGNLAAEYADFAPTGPTGTHYRTTDHLGSTRLVTDATLPTPQVISRRDFFPFGEEIPAGATFGNRQVVTDGQGTTTYNDPSGYRQQFTGKERDDESGLDYFGARYMAASLGRFTSADPLMASARPLDPQTWNRYAYTLGNPLRYVDPDGLKEISVEDCESDSNCTVVSVNVILDKNANQGNGLTKKQLSRFNKLLQGTKDDFGNGKIALNVSYTTGEVTNAGVQGLDSSKANIFLSSYVPTSVTQNATLSGSLNGVTVPDPAAGSDVMFISANNATSGWIGSGVPFVASFTNTLTHEFIHNLSGDTSRTGDSTFSRGWREFQVDRQASGVSLGINYIRPEQRQRARSYTAPLNGEAVKPSKR